MNNGSGLFSEAEFKGRGIIKLAPDVLVYVGGSLTASIIAPVSGGPSNIDFKDGISSVNVQCNIDPPGSSTATIEVLAPVYNERSNYWVPFSIPNEGIQRRPIFVPMAEVKIYMKGRFMVKGAPQYYPVFWGFIVTVEENYAGGVNKITLQCADILHWWGLTTLTTHPIPESRIAAGGGLVDQQDITAYATIFKASNPFVIMKRLFHEMGMSSFVANSWVAQLAPPGGIFSPNQMQNQARGIMSHWRSRFKNISSLLKMYGITGKETDVQLNSSVKGGETFKIRTINPDTIEEAEFASRAESATAQQRVHQYNFDEKFIKRFTPFMDYNKMGSFQQAETMTKLDIAQELKTRIDFEFYQDTNGTFIFKPPFYNMDVKGLQPYEIEPSDILSNSFSFDSDSIITVLEVFGSFHPQLKDVMKPRHPGFYMDPALAEQFGIRYKSLNMQYVTDSSIIKNLTFAQMNLINAQAHSGSLTIPLRPELRLGYPIYIRHRDSYHYVRSINHSFDYGGGANTALSLFTERRRMFAVDGEGNYKNEVLKSYAYKFKNTVAPTKKKNPDDPDFITDKIAINAKLTEIQQGEYNVQGMKSGLYDLVQDSNVLAVDPESVPYTDENGYRVIGAFPYGRGLSAICIDSDKLLTLTESEQYQVTNMQAAGSAQGESKRMSGLFFNEDNPPKEGAVPMYLQGESISMGVPPPDDGSPLSLYELPPPTTANTVPSNPAPSTTPGVPDNSRQITNMAPVGNMSQEQNEALINDAYLLRIKTEEAAVAEMEGQRVNLNDAALQIAQIEADIAAEAAATETAAYAEDVMANLQREKNVLNQANTLPYSSVGSVPPGTGSPDTAPILVSVVGSAVQNGGNN